MDEKGQVPEDGETQPRQEEGSGEHEEDPPPIQVDDGDENVLESKKRDKNVWPSTYLLHGTGESIDFK